MINEKMGDITPRPNDWVTPEGMEDMKPVEFRKEVRKNWHMMLWLENKSYREIASITGWSHNTVRQDLDEMIARWQITETIPNEVRKLALVRLGITQGQMKQQIADLKAIPDEKKSSAVFNNITKLLSEIASIDKAILDRFTQAASESEAVRDAEEKGKIVMDYFRDRYGAEAFEGFEEYYQKRLYINRKNRGVA